MVDDGGSPSNNGHGTWIGQCGWCNDIEYIVEYLDHVLWQTNNHQNGSRRSFSTSGGFDVVSLARVFDLTLMLMTPPGKHECLVDTGYHHTSRNTCRSKNS